MKIASGPGIYQKWLVTCTLSKLKELAEMYWEIAHVVNQLVLTSTKFLHQQLQVIISFLCISLSYIRRIF